MITFALVALLMAQDSNMALSPRVRAMIDRFPPPRPGLPSISVKFSRDSVWIGEQVELVTATWFPRALRDQLRRLPVISSPSLTGLWSARNQQLPIPAGMRLVGNQVYDLYISWQTIFPLGAGQIAAPPATLTYNLPTSTAYFAPEERKTYRSSTATLVVRAIPAALVGSLGPGPTAHGLHIAWRASGNTIRAGAPAIVELAISGDGNLTLWPAPATDWPRDLHVYPEPTIERQVPAAGLISGEKRFRFTVVADSAGVLTLPLVRYPYFDPATGSVDVAIAPATTLAVLQRPVAPGDRRALTVAGNADVPLATRIMRVVGPFLLILVVLPLVLMGWRRSRRRPTTVVAPPGDPEAALRAALGSPVEAGEAHVVAALRARGVPRDDAEHVLRWLSAVGRRRYGPAKVEVPEAPPALTRVMERLRNTSTAALLLLVVLLPMRAHAQQADGVSRFSVGDFPGAARAFETALVREPAAAGLWRDLGSARWMQRDDVAAAAAWLRAFALAPRDPALRDAWRQASTIPPDVRGRAPRIPLSRDELILLAASLWLVAMIAGAVRWRRTMWLAASLCAVALGVAGTRWFRERPGRVLVAQSTTMRISPHPATTGLGEIPAWTLVRVQRRIDNWVLVGGQVSTAGSVAGTSVQGWIPLTSVAPIGPLD